MGSIHMTQNEDQWRAFLNTLINIPVSHNVKMFFTS
jgi:hypothetical protein